MYKSLIGLAMLATTAAQPEQPTAWPFEVAAAAKHCASRKAVKYSHSTNLEDPNVLDSTIETRTLSGDPLTYRFEVSRTDHIQVGRRVEEDKRILLGIWVGDAEEHVLAYLQFGTEPLSQAGEGWKLEDLGSIRAVYLNPDPLQHTFLSVDYAAGKLERASLVAAIDREPIAEDFKTTGRAVHITEEMLKAVTAHAHRMLYDAYRALIANDPTCRQLPEDREGVGQAIREQDDQRPTLMGELEQLLSTGR